MTTVHLFQRCLKPLAILLFALPLVAQAQDQVRIIQTNAAGDRIQLIDPVTNTVVGEILGIEVAHGATASPDGRWIYASNEADDTLDVADAQTLKVIKKIPLSGRPNNVSITPDGGRVYVGIRQAVGDNPGVADVIDTASLTKVYLSFAIPWTGSHQRGACGERDSRVGQRRASAVHPRRLDSRGRGHPATHRRSTSAGRVTNARHADAAAASL